MTQPLIVDTDLLGTASASLAAAAAEIPVVPPPLSVSGSDPLSTAIGNGSVEIEAPMAALPAIKTDALTTAQNVGAAGQRYASTDEALAAKAARHDFGNSGGSQGIGGEVRPPRPQVPWGGRQSGRTGPDGRSGPDGRTGPDDGHADANGTAGRPDSRAASPDGRICTAEHDAGHSGGAVQQVAQLAGQFGKTPDDGAQSEQSVSDRELIPGEKIQGNARPTPAW